MRVNFSTKFSFGFILFSFLFLSDAWSTVRLPSVLSDHMVLQRNSTVRLWGWSGPSEALQVTASWDGHTYDLKADRNARWEILIPTPEAGGPFTIEIKGSNTVLLRDILIGEVWICSGQSNMEWSANSGYDGAEAEVKSAGNPKIRLFKIPKTTSENPQDDCAASWEVCSPETVQAFSAVGYHFGKKLNDELGIPIGLIQAAWGGTAAEVWTPEEVVKSDPEFSKWDEVLPASNGWPREPGKAFNAMIYPVINFKLAGAIWYQGETNTANAELYRRLFPAMIQSWRDAWDFPMPFYFVQIAPYNYGAPMQGALVQESQLKTMQKVHNTGMVVVSDIGNFYDIHPRNKIDVGKRLANWALARTYGVKDVAYSGPIYKSNKVEFGKMTVSFDHADQGLLSKDGPLMGFELAGEDQIYFPAQAVIKGNDVEVVSDYVLNPVAVRFGFGNIKETNLYNQFGLPASSFRSDEWPIIVKEVSTSIEYNVIAEAYLVTLASEGAAEIKYTTNGDPPGLSGLTYRKPFYIDKDCTIKALAFFDGRASDAITTKEVKMNMATFKPIELATRYDASKSGGGDQALVDGLFGSRSLNDGKWQGYLGNNLDVVIDFGMRVELNKISLNALKDQDDKVFLPNKVMFEISNDGERFVEVYRKPLFHGREHDVEIFNYLFEFNKPRKTRYIRITADNLGECPVWHKNAGDRAWLMVDEIVAE